MSEYIDALHATYRKRKLELTKQAAKDIEKIYSRSIRECLRQLATTKSELTQTYLKSRANALFDDLQAMTKSHIGDSSTIVADLHRELAELTAYSPGHLTNFSMMFADTRQKTIKAMLLGEIYKDGKGLSPRIWNHASKAIGEVQEVVLAGLARGSSATDLARMLETYIQPDKRLPWSKAKVAEKLGDAYAGWNPRIEYNSLRMARTTITHSFTLSNKLAAKENVFLEYFKWHSAFAHRRTCDECESMDGNVYTVAQLPYDHPNGLCWETPYYDKPLEHYQDRIDDWINGGKDSYLDEWYQKVYLPSNPLTANPVSFPPIPQNTSTVKISESQAPVDLLDREAFKKAVISEDRETTFNNYMAWIDDIIKDQTGHSYTMTREADIFDDLYKAVAKDATKSIDDSLAQLPENLKHKAAEIRNQAVRGAPDDVKDVADALLRRLRETRDIDDVVDFTWRIKNQRPETIVDRMKNDLLEVFRNQFAEHGEEYLAKMDDMYARAQAGEKVKGMQATFGHSLTAPVNPYTTDDILLLGSRQRHLRSVMSSGQDRVAADECKRFYKSFVDRSVKPNKDVVLIRERSIRAYARTENVLEAEIHVAVGDDAGVYIHEFAHCIHETREDVARTVQMFFDERIKGEKLTTIYKGTDEVGYKDKFFSHYCGRVYPWEREKGAEILSMGMERMYNSPAAFLAEDPEYYKLVYGIMNGLVL